MKKGFTLVELLGVIVILSLLMLIVFPNVLSVIKKSNEDKCYYLHYMTNNNLDFDLINTITASKENVSTVANKGEISFIIYNLFSGTIAFPGMSCHTWYHGTGVIPKPVGGRCYEMNGGSKATPKLRNDEFRLF